MIGHNGYFACSGCHQEGTYINGRVAFDVILSKKRTDQEFRDTVDKYHQSKKSPFLKLKYKIHMVMSFPGDVMHVLDLGVTDFCLETLIDTHKIDLDRAEEFVKNIRPFIPSDFPRKFRSISEIKRFKASEFRFFALYCGIPFLKYCCKDDAAINHFSLLSVAYRLLMGKNGKVDELSLRRSRQLLEKFVAQFPEIYGREFVSFNVHALLHLPDFVEKFGPVDGFSCYKYENYYQMLRKWIRKPSNYFIQILRRWVQTEGGVKLKDGNESKGNVFIISSSKKDCCVLLKDGSTFIIEEVGFEDDRIVYAGKKYVNHERVFTLPFVSIESTDLNISTVSILNEEKIKVAAEDILCKMVRIPLPNDKFYVLPLLHYN